MSKQIWYDDSLELHKIKELTRTLCNMAEENIGRSKTAETYWSRMMRCWKENLDVIGYNVVYAALYCIYWGTYPKDFPDNPDLLRLVELIKLEFLKVNVDVECAKSKQFFNSSLTKVKNSNSPYFGTRRFKSSAFNLFMNAKMMYKLYGGEIKVENLNLLTITVHDFEDMKEKAWRRHLYEEMKAYIAKLIPEASMWSDDKFTNDAEIVRQLREIYGVDLKWCNNNFDQLINVLKKKQNDDYFGDDLLSMTDFPMTLARVIWPDKTEECIEVLFCDIYTYLGNYIRFISAYGSRSERVDSAHEALQKSWIYRQIAEWYENRSHKLSDKTRSCYLNASLGNF